MTLEGHICTRFNAPHLSTPTENHVLHRCRRPHPPPRRPRAPRRLREVLQGAHSIPFIHHPLRSACFSSSPKWEQRKPVRGGPDARSDASSRVGSRVHATRSAASGVEARVPRCDAVRVSSRDASPARSRRSNRHRGPRFTTLRTNQSVTGPTRGDARAVRPGRCVGPPRAMRPRRTEPAFASAFRTHASRARPPRSRPDERDDDTPLIANPDEERQTKNKILTNPPATPPPKSRLSSSLPAPPPAPRSSPRLPPRRSPRPSPPPSPPSPPPPRSPRRR